MNINKDKPWRIHSEEEFEKALDELLDRELENFDEYFKKVKKIHLKCSREDSKAMKEFFESMVNQTSHGVYSKRDKIEKVPDSPRVNGRNYHAQDIDRILSELEISVSPEGRRKLRVKLLSSNVDLWKESSMNPTSARDTMIKLIAGKRYDVSLICISYICKSSLMTEDFIKDLIFVTSPLFSFENWNDPSVETVCDLTLKWISSGKKNGYHLVKELAVEDFHMYDSLKQLIDRGQRDMENKVQCRESEIRAKQKVIQSYNTKIGTLEKQFDTIDSFVMSHAPEEDWNIQKYFDLFDKLVEEIQKKHTHFNEEDWDRRRKEFRKRNKQWSDQTFMREMWTKWDSLPRKLRIEISDLQRSADQEKKKIERNVNAIEEIRKAGVQIEFSDRIDWYAIDKDTLSPEFVRRFSPVFHNGGDTP